MTMSSSSFNLNRLNHPLPSSPLLQHPGKNKNSIIQHRYGDVHDRVDEEKKQELEQEKVNRTSNFSSSSLSSEQLDIPRRAAPRLYKYKTSDSSLPSGRSSCMDHDHDENDVVGITYTATTNIRTRKRRRRSSFSVSSSLVMRRCFQKLPSFSSFLGQRRHQQQSKLVVAVLLWYSLGVVSISTSKLLLTPYQWPSEQPVLDDDHINNSTQHYAHYLQHIGGVPPLWLTLQQLLLGSTFLRFLLSINFLNSPGLHPIETILAVAKVSHPHDYYKNEPQLLYNVLWLRTSSPQKTLIDHHVVKKSSLTTLWYLIKAGICFSMGFLTTNLAFGAASPTFVETVKAAEPITSAILAVAWKIDTMTSLEVTGLAGIITGVLMSTLGGGSDGSSEGNNSTTSTATMFLACGIVMTSNLCFSLRGLYQKLFLRATANTTGIPSTDVGGRQPQQQQEQQPHQLSLEQQEPNLTMQQQSETPQLDDLNLQFRMQQTGVFMLAIPALIWEGPSLLYHAVHVASVLSTRTFLTVLFKYFALAVVNGLAFSSYKCVFI
jgi:hypothetical protein